MTINGGTGMDLFIANTGSFAAKKGITAKLGDGDNRFELNSPEIVIGGPLVVSHLNASGTVQTGLNAAGSLSINGPVTISYGTGTGSTNTSFTSGGGTDISGLVKVTSAMAANAVLLSSTGLATYKGGVNLNFDGVLMASFAGRTIVTKAITVQGGAADQTVNLNVGSARVGSLTFNLGDGLNTVALGSPELIVTGAVKLTSGSGNDIVSITGAEARLAKGLSFKAGDGVNQFQVTTDAFQSGPIKVDFGAHAAGTSAVAFSGDRTKITGPISITGKGGNETFTAAGVSFSSGPITAILGDGNNTLAFGQQSLRLGALNFTGGGGNDVVSLASIETALPGIKATLGNGTNQVIASSFNLALGSLQMSAGTGDDSLTLDAQKLAVKSINAALGDGLSVVDISGATVQLGTVTLLAGNHIMGSNDFGISGTASLSLGALKVIVAGGNTQGTFTATNGPGRFGPVNLTTGNGNDTFLIQSGTSGSVGPVKFVSGDGNNEFAVLAFGGKIGAIQYLGGAGDDEMGVGSFLGTAGAVTFKAGAGNYGVEIGGDIDTRYTGPVIITAANTAGQTGSVEISGATFLGMTITGGDGIDTVTINDSIFSSAFKLDLKGGADVVDVERNNFGGPTLFRSSATFLLGDGADILNIGMNTPAAHAEFKALAKFDGGAGTDTAHVSTMLFANVYISGQPVLSGFETAD